MGEAIFLLTFTSSPVSGASNYEQLTGSCMHEQKLFSFAVFWAGISVAIALLPVNSHSRVFLAYVIIKNSFTTFPRPAPQFSLCTLFGSKHTPLAPHQP